MSAEFTGTVVRVYGHGRSAGRNREQAANLTRLAGAGSILRGNIQSRTVDSSVCHRFLPRRDARKLHRRYQVSWPDAMVVNSAIETGCSILWSEDLNDGQRYGTVIVRNPFR